MFLPEYAPQEWRDREKLWNAVEEAETAKGIRLAREFVVALPIELNHEEQIPNRDIHQRFLDAPGDSYAIMQLKQDASVEVRFMGLKSLSRPPLPDDYDAVYTGPIVRTQNRTATLDNLFEIFNRNRPVDFTDHSFTISSGFYTELK